MERDHRESIWGPRTVLVTGARGFIASHLCQRLLREGARVYGVSRSRSGSDASGIRWLSADLAEPSAAAAVFEHARPDFVFHLAGHVTGSQAVTNVEPTLLQNVTSTVRLLTAAVQAGKPRVVLTGSMQEPHLDDPSAVLCSPYAASKWVCSGYARMFHELYGQPVSIARPFMVYGPGQWDVAKVLPYAIISLLRGEAPKLASGDRALDWVYVEDVVDGLLAVAESGHVDATPIDLGTGRLTSVREVIEQIELALDCTGTAQFGAVADRTLERPHAARADETRRLIGWAASTDFPTGLLRSIEWYRSQLAVGTL